ncbi:MAG: NFACT family protein [Acidaminococcaceae bacterium]
MNLEGITLHILSKNLAQTLVGGKIYKVFMPAAGSVLLLIKKERETCALMADFGGASPLLYLADSLPERPNTPPAFCMLLRKHLEEGRISSITQEGLERVLTMEIDVIGPARQIITKKLIFELTGKNSNIIFTQDELILDSLKHIGKGLSRFRQILPNLPYVAPPLQTGLNFLQTKPAAIADLLQADFTTPVLKNLITKTTGIGKFTATELLHSCQIAPQATGLTLAERQLFIATLTAWQSVFSRHALGLEQLPVYGLISKQNRMQNISLIKPTLLEDDVTLKEFISLNAALVYSTSLVPVQIPELDLLTKTVSLAQVKTEKKLLLLQKDLVTAEDAETEKIIADTLMANIYHLQKGQTSCTLANIYTGEDSTITLNPLFTPTENAQAYYKRYNKYKRALSEIKKQQQETLSLLTYLQSLESSLETATTKNEISEIKQELISAGILVETGKKKKQQTMPKSQPLIIKLSSDTTLYIGKNNKQNDFVTFGLAKPRDLWFHTKNIPGSHVVLKTTLPAPLAQDIEIAAQCAAYFSKARTSSQVPVDYVEKRFVKKPAGAKPGLVIFTNQQTLYVTPETDCLQTLLPSL